MKKVNSPGDVIVLAGGLGTRLKGILGDIPKCMAPVSGRPFLEFQLSYLKNTGHTRIILSVGYLRKAVMDHFGDYWNGCEILYAVEETPLGTGGAVLNALHLCSSEEVIVLNGDTYFPVDLSRLHDAYTHADTDAVIALRRVEEPGRYGAVVIDENNRVTRFSEKDAAVGSGLINGGIYLLKKKSFLNTGYMGVFSLEKEVFPQFCSNKGVIGIEFNDYFLDIGIPSDLERAQLELPAFR